MNNFKLKVNKRNILGKHTNSLRQKGITPIHIFGHNVESLTLECDSAELKKVISMGGTTRIIQIDIEKEKQPRSVFIHEIQRNPISGQILHVDFYQVDKKVKMTAEIPIIFTGESMTSKSKGYIIEHLLTHLEIETFPDKMPPHVEIDISRLKEVGDTIHVKDINLGPDISITSDPYQMIVKISKIKASAETEPVAPKVVEEVKTTTETETTVKEESK
ncbi:MAG: 50S ribosomal protein L25 [Dehalococcoidales bacterium]|nr:50S ribosomal protein L25 [Dehalococcoidales bacterium]